MTATAAAAAAGTCFACGQERLLACMDPCDCVAWCENRLCLYCRISVTLVAGEGGVRSCMACHGIYCDEHLYNCNCGIKLECGVAGCRNSGSEEAWKPLYDETATFIWCDDCGALRCWKHARVPGEPAQDHHCSDTCCVWEEGEGPNCTATTARGTRCRRLRTQGALCKLHARLNNPQEPCEEKSSF